MERLLWADPKTLLKKRSEKINFLWAFSQVSFLALEAFQKFYFEKKYELFDPHLGDNLCQIRALQIASLKSEVFSTETWKTLKDLASNSEKSFHVFSEQAKTRKGKADFLDATVTIEELMAQHYLSFADDSNVGFLFLCFFLSRFKKIENDLTRIDLEKIQLELSFRKKFSKKMVLLYQQRLCEDSCEFIYQTATHFPELQWATPSTRLLKAEDGTGRCAVSFFLSSFVMIKASIALNLVQCLRIHFENGRLLHLFFEGTEHINKTETLHLRRFSPCIVWDARSGLSQYESEKMVALIDGKGLLEVLLATCALHPQYLGSDEEWVAEEFSFENERLNHIFRPAVSLGTQLSGKDSQQKTLEVYHVHCTNLMNIDESYAIVPSDFSALA